MKIIQVIPTLGYGGAEKLLIEYSKRLSITDQLIIICLFDSSNTSNYHVLKKINVRVIFLNKKKGLDFSIVYKLFALLLDLKPDVVHSHLNSLKYLFLYLLFFSKKIKFFHTIHNQPEIDSVKLEKLLNKFIFKYFSVIPIALSKSLKEAVDKYYKINKCVPLNNGIDYNNYYFNQIIRDELRNKHEIQFDEIVIGHVGRFNTQKNHDFLIDILINYNKTNTKFKAILLGDGVLMDKIKHKVLTNK
jgi:glycosyltransferase involved in cell wall biosynthesis